MLAAGPGPSIKQNVSADCLFKVVGLPVPGCDLKSVAELVFALSPASGPVFDLGQAPTMYEALRATFYKTREER